MVSFFKTYVVCLHVCLCATWISGTCRGQKRTLDSLELDLQTAVSQMGIEPESSERGTSVFYSCLFCPFRRCWVLWQPYHTGSIANSHLLLSLTTRTEQNTCPRHIPSVGSCYKETIDHEGSPWATPPGKVGTGSHAIRTCCQHVLESLTDYYSSSEYHPLGSHLEPSR